MGNLYVGHSVSLRNDGDASAVIFGGITQMDIPLSTEITNEVTAGSYFARNTNIKSIKPKITFASRDVAKVLDNIPLLGKTIDGDTNDGFCLWMSQLENGETMSGSNHRKIRMRKGRIIATQASCNHQDDLSISCEAMAIWDKTNNPIIPTGGLALPGAAADPDRFTLHSATVGGVAFECLQSVSVNFGVTVEMFGCDSDIYDTHLQVTEIKPEITFTTLQPSQFATSGGVDLTGLLGTHANTVFYFRKRSQGGDSAFEDLADTVHLSSTASGILTIDKAFGSSGNKRGESGYKLTCSYDGTNNPIIWDTAVAID